LFSGTEEVYDLKLPKIKCIKPQVKSVPLNISSKLRILTALSQNLQQIETWQIVSYFNFVASKREIAFHITDI